MRDNVERSPSGKKEKQAVHAGVQADCWDNAVAESFFASLKTELGDTFESASDARARIRNYIEDFYNCQRLHSSIGYVSPVHFELLNQTAARAA